MKILFLLSLLFIAVPSHAETPISIEDFKKLDIADQFKEIDKATPEREAELQKIQAEQVNSLIDFPDGAEGLKMWKRGRLAETRAHRDIARLFNADVKLWEAYWGQEVKRLYRDGQGIPKKDRHKMEILVLGDYGAAMRRARLAISLIAQTVGTPGALVLATKSAGMSALYLERRPSYFRGNDIDWNTLQDEPARIFSKEELKSIDIKLDELLAGLKELPRVPQKELQKEYDAITDTHFGFHK